MTQSVSFTSATFEDFAEANLWFSVSALAKKKKKTEQAIKFLGILTKNMSP